MDFSFWKFQLSVIWSCITKYFFFLLCRRLVRLQILFANSLFMACRFNPDGCQVLTAGRYKLKVHCGSRVAVGKKIILFYFATIRFYFFNRCFCFNLSVYIVTVLCSMLSYCDLFCHTGTDRKIQYWECYDGSLIRDLEGSTAAAINSLDISQDGSFFVTGSNDFLVKVSEKLN